MIHEEIGIFHMLNTTEFYEYLVSCTFVDVLNFLKTCMNCDEDIRT